MLDKIIRRIDASPVLFHLVNLLVASVWIYRAYSAVVGMRTNWNVLGRAQVITSALLLLNLVLLVIFYVLRRRSTDAPSDVASIVFAHLGTWLPLLFGFQIAGDRPTAPCVPNVAVVPLLWAMALCSGVLTLGFVSLGRSWGIIPANRGVRTGGLYRFVRHPIYSSYIVFDVAYVLLATSWLNVFVATVVIVSLYVRTIHEEAVLLRDPEYAAYAARTRSKLVPWVV